MISRRLALAGGAALLGSSASAGGARAASYDAFLAGVRAEALREGVPGGIVSRALALSRAPNAKVLQLDRHQPEFTLTWAQYRARVLSTGKIDGGRAAYAANRSLFQEIGTQYGVDPEGMIGIWGLESFYGKLTGGFSVIDALATLAFDGRRSAFFRSELLKAMKILGEGDIAPEAMTGSYAGAMGQPQFMPSAYLTYAVSYPAGGKRNIWTSLPDVLASIANYLARCGWHAGEPSAQPIRVPDSLPQSVMGRQYMRSLGEWTAQGVRREDGATFSRSDVQGAIVRPDGPGGEAFMIYHNFNVIRRYNPSDFYALAVGLLGQETT